MADPKLRRAGDGDILERALGSAKRPHSHPFTLPGLAGEQGMQACLWALRNMEIANARAQAMKYLHAYFKALDPETPVELFLQADPNFFEAELYIQMLAVALRDPGNPSSPLTTPQSLRVLTGPDDVQCLMAAYNDWCNLSSPLRKIRTAEQLQELIAAVGKEPGASISLSYYDTDSLRGIAHALAAELISQAKKS
jgi:hypothetical protein